MAEVHDSDAVSVFWEDFDSAWRDGGALSAEEISARLQREQNYSLAVSTVRGWLEHKRLPRKDDDFAEMCLLLVGKDRANELMARLQAARRAAARTPRTLLSPDSSSTWLTQFLKRVDLRKRAGWQWNKIGALAGVVSVIVALVAWLFPELPASSKTPSFTAAKEKLHIKIPPSSYDVSRSSWKPYGPFYEAEGDLYSRYGVTHAHAYGNSTGRFVYHVDIGSFEGAHAELRTRLSADAIGYSDPTGKYSDVTLAINDVPFPIRRVMPDNGSGGYYTWQFDAKLLRHGGNVIEFIVEQNAQFPNGLCIYGDAIAPGYIDEWITLQTE